MSSMKRLAARDFEDILQVNMFLGPDSVTTDCIPVCYAYFWGSFSNPTRCYNTDFVIQVRWMACVCQDVATHWSNSRFHVTGVDFPYSAVTEVPVSGLWCIQHSRTAEGTERTAATRSTQRHTFVLSEEEIVQYENLQISRSGRLCSIYQILRNYWFFYNADCMYNSSPKVTNWT